MRAFDVGDASDDKSEPFDPLRQAVDEFSADPRPDRTRATSPARASGPQVESLPDLRPRQHRTIAYRAVSHQRVDSARANPCRSDNSPRRSTLSPSRVVPMLRRPSSPDKASSIVSAMHAYVRPSAKP